MNETSQSQYAGGTDTGGYCVQFRIDMTPEGQKRGRVGAFKLPDGSVRGTIFKDKKARIAEDTFALMAYQHRPRGEDRQPIVLTGRVSVSIVAVFPRTADQNKVSSRTGLPLRDPDRAWHVKKPDADNVAKLVLDALKEWWVDDCQVNPLCVSKKVAKFGEAPHYEINIAWE